MEITLARAGLKPGLEGTPAQRMKVRALVAFGIYKDAAYMGLPLTYEKSVTRQVERRLNWAMGCQPEGTGRYWTSALRAASKLERGTAAREGALRSILLAAAANFVGNEIETTIRSCLSMDRKPDWTTVESAVSAGMKERLDDLFTREASALFEDGEITDVAGRFVKNHGLLYNLYSNDAFYLKWNGVRMVHNAVAEWSYKFNERLERGTFIVDVAFEMASLGCPSLAAGLLLM